MNRKVNFQQITHLSVLYRKTSALTFLRGEEKEEEEKKKQDH